MIKAFSAILYILVFVPIWCLRRTFGFSRFECAFHKGATAWDLPVGINVSPE